MAPQRDGKVPDIAVFAQRLNKHRTLKGWTHNDLARETGIAAVMIEQYERQVTVPKIDVVHKLAKALGVSVDYLLGLTDIPESDYLRRVESIETLWDNEMLEVLYRGREIPEEDKEVISEIVRKWIEKSRGQDKRGE